MPTATSATAASGGGKGGVVCAAFCVQRSRLTARRTQTNAKPSPGGKVAERQRGRMRGDLLFSVIRTYGFRPHQSKIRDFCQLLPGEAFVAICQTLCYNASKENGFGRFL